MSDYEDDLDFGYDDNFEDEEIEDEIEDEDEEIEDDGLEDEGVGDQPFDDEDSIPVNVFTDADVFNNVVLNKKPIKETEKVGANTGIALTKLYNEMLKKVPRISPEGFQLSFMSEEEKIALSVCEINNTGEGPGTLYDELMGPIVIGKPCLTCKRQVSSCPGHYGRIKTPHIFHPEALDYIIYTLKSICHACGKSLTTEKTWKANGFDKYEGMQRLKQIAELYSPSSSSKSKTKRIPYKCPNRIEVVDDEGNPVVGKDGKIETRICGAHQHFYPSSSSDKSDNLGTIKYESYSEDSVSISSMNGRDVFEIFDRISDFDAALLGFGKIYEEVEDGNMRYKYQLYNHPRNFITRSVLVQPNRMRPKVDSKMGSNGEWVDSNDPDLKGIITNTKNYNQTGRENFLREVYNCYRNFMSADKSAKGTKNMSMKDRQKGKTGTFASMSAKRPDYSARSVISANDAFGYGRVGMPRWMQQFITYPDTVFSRNQKTLQKMLQMGRIKYFIRKNGQDSGVKRMVNDEIRRNYKLQIGDIVFRLIKDGDIAYLGRQPSLSGASLQAMTIIIIDDNTIQFALPHTKAFNADQRSATGRLKRLLLPSM